MINSSVNLVRNLLQFQRLNLSIQSLNSSISPLHLYQSNSQLERGREMSARLLQKRITSALFHHQSNATPLKEILCDYSLFSRKRHQSPFLSIFNRAAAYQTQVKEDVEESDKMVEDGSKNNLHAALSELKTSSRHDMAIVFTCKVCETRSVKTACRSSYDKGVVVVRCGGCNNMHLIADRLGWFGEPGSIEELLAARGEGFKTGSADTLNLTLDDLAGVKSFG